jgi:hypothetical protein
MPFGIRFSVVTFPPAFSPRCAPPPPEPMCFAAIAFASFSGMPFSTSAAISESSPLFASSRTSATSCSIFG